MITITRKMKNDALRNVENLSYLFFEGESNAHKFVIQPDGVSFDGYSVTARYLRADDQLVGITGALVDGSAEIILSASCYAVQGRCKLFIYVTKTENEGEETEKSTTVCIYACQGMVVNTVNVSTAGDTEPIIEPYPTDALVERVAALETSETALTTSVTALETSVGNMPANIKDGTGTGAIIEGSLTGTNANVASDRYAHAEGLKTTASGKYAHAEGAHTTASGDNAHAEGSGNTASNMNAHAEGYNTEASGYVSHAEGSNNTASGTSSHAEGSTNAASGDYAHAEGHYAQATGESSHAEGYYTTASGMEAHAEGSFTTASGINSHATGQYTIADARNMYAGGRYNKPESAYFPEWVAGTQYNVGDQVKISTSHNYYVCKTANTDETFTSANWDRAYINGKSISSFGNQAYLLEAIGNGSSEKFRSNARELDGAGNEKLAGSLTLGMDTSDEVTITAAQLKQLLALLGQ